MVIPNFQELARNSTFYLQVVLSRPSPLRVPEAMEFGFDRPAAETCVYRPYLLNVEGIRPALLTAAGISGKAANHLEDSDKQEAIEGLIAKFLEPAGENFVEKLVFRFLLTGGDALGGSMRNIGGFMAQKKPTRSIIACLKLAGRSCRWLHSENECLGGIAGRRCRY